MKNRFGLLQHHRIDDIRKLICKRLARVRVEQTSSGVMVTSLQAAAIAVASRAMSGSGLSRAVDQWLSQGSLPDSNTLLSWAAPSRVAIDSGLVSSCRRYAWQVANALDAVDKNGRIEIAARPIDDVLTSGRAGVAERMVSERAAFDPRPDRAGALASRYAEFVAELGRRGWIDGALQTHVCRPRRR